MTCEEFRLQLTAFSLGELDPEERQRAHDHVAACDDCASRLLRDRQLTAVVRATTVAVPTEARAAVLAAVRAEAGPGAKPAGQLRTAPVAPDQTRRPLRRRHWVALAAALLAAAAVVAAALLVTPAPDPGSPLAAAWSSYHARGKDGLGTPSDAQAERLFAVLGPDSRPPDLRAYGLRPDGWEARDLAGHLASAAEYRDPEGKRLTVMRWRGELPAVARAPAGSGLKAYRWGRHTSYWWRADGVVWCLVGTIDPDRLYKIAEGLGGESSEAELG
jgi:hypothetical protein